MQRVVAAAGAAGAAVAASAAVWSGRDAEPSGGAGRTAVRLGRTVASFCRVAQAYSGLAPDDDWEEAHRRGAAALYALAVANGGLYVKLGQVVGVLDHVLPAVYISALRPVLPIRSPSCPGCRRRPDPPPLAGRFSTTRRTLPLKRRGRGSRPGSAARSRNAFRASTPSHWPRLRSPRSISPSRPRRAGGLP